MLLIAHLPTLGVLEVTQTHIHMACAENVNSCMHVFFEVAVFALNPEGFHGTTPHQN